jgi:hypothetical protein
VIANGCFRISAPKAENGFVTGENCFVGRPGRNIGAKNSMISMEWLADDIPTKGRQPTFKKPSEIKYILSLHGVVFAIFVCETRGTPGAAPNRLTRCRRRPGRAPPSPPATRNR